MTQILETDEWSWVWSETVHIGIFGSTGSGKSSVGEYLAESFYEHTGDKVIDFMDEGRLESAFYRFPEDRPELLRVIRAMGLKPKAFPVEVLYPRYCGKGTVKQVPEYFHMFTLPLSDLTVDDLRLLMQTPSREWTFITEIMLDRALNEVTEDDDLPTLIRNIMSQLRKGIITLGEDTVPLGDRRVLYPIIRRLHELDSLGIVTAASDPRCLNLPKILRNREVITSFSVFNIGSVKMRYAVWSYLLRKILEVKRLEWNLPRTVLFIRECRNLAPSKLGVFTDAVYTKRNLARIAREGRDASLRLLVDSQRFLDVDIDVRSQLDFLILLRLYFDDIQSAIQSVYMDFQTQYKIQQLQRGVGCFLGRGRYRYPVQLPVSLSKHKKEGEHLYEVCEKHNVPLVPYDPGSVYGLSRAMQRRVLTLQDLPKTFTPKQFRERNSEMPRGTAYAVLSGLTNQGLLVRNKGKYEISDQCMEILDRLSRQNRKNTSIYPDIFYGE